MSAQDWSVPLAGEQFTNGRWIEVRSPYDGTCSAGSRRAARRRSTAPSRPRRRRTRSEPLAPWKRAEILDRAAAPARRAHRGVRRHHRRRSGQADQDRTGRGAARGLDVHVRGGRGAHARRRDGADGRERGRRGEARVHAAAADRRRRRDQPVQLPAQPRRAQARAGDRGRLPGGAEAGDADAHCRRSRSRACCSTSAVSRPTCSTSSPAAAERSATRSSTTTTSR